MPLFTAETTDAMPFLLPWERIGTNPDSPEIARLIQSSSLRRILFVVSAIVCVVCIPVAVTLIAVGAEGVAATIAALLMIPLFVAFVYFCGTAPSFIQPSVVVLRQHEVVMASLFGKRRRPLGTMAALHRTNVTSLVAGFTADRSLMFRLFFEEGRPLKLAVSSDDYDARELIRHVEEAWAQVRPAAVLDRLAAGETITIPNAFVMGNLQYGPHFRGSVSLSPASLNIRQSRRNEMEISWDQIADVGVNQEGRLIILTPSGEVLADVDGLANANMLAMNIADYAKLGRKPSGSESPPSPS